MQLITQMRAGDIIQCPMTRTCGARTPPSIKQLCGLHTFCDGEHIYTRREKSSYVVKRVRAPRVLPGH